MPVTIASLQNAKQHGEKITMLTCYDASFAKLCEQQQIDILFVGDSLGNVIQGHTTTVPVTLADMVYHTGCVARVAKKSFILADMPYLSYANPEMAIEAAKQLMQAGAHMVKCEWASEATFDVLKALTEQGVPTCMHLGLTPQHIHQVGRFRVQGRGSQADILVERALACQQFGAQLLVLECIPGSLGQAATEQLEIPTIGIGAGNGTDGQVLVIYDMLGMGTGHQLSFVRNFMQDVHSVAEAIAAYRDAVKDGSFPSELHTFGDS